MISHHFLVIGFILCLVSGCLIAACTTLQENQTVPIPDTSPSTSHPKLEPEQTTSEPVYYKTPLIESGSEKFHLSSEITGTGIIIYQDIEEGFFGVISDDGRRFLPQSIPKDLQVNGTPVSFIFKPMSNMVTIHMWGEPVEIISLQALGEDEVTNSSILFIKYEKAGGIGTSFETLRIYNNQRGEVRKWNLVQEFNITNDEMESIRTILKKAEFRSLNAEYMPSGPTPNSITYTITAENRTIKCIYPDIPDQVVSIIKIMDEFLEKHTVSPITANITLNETAWRLISYLRSDNILIQVQNITHISAIFGKDGRVTGSSGCNSFSATFKHTKTALSFGPISVTRMACKDSGIVDIENAFLDHLKNIRSVSGKERTLFMNDENNSPLLIFELMKN